MHDIMCVTLCSQGFRETGERRKKTGWVVSGWFSRVFLCLRFTLCCRFTLMHVRIWKEKVGGEPVFQGRVGLVCFHPTREVSMIVLPILHVDPSTHVPFSLANTW